MTASTAPSPQQTISRAEPDLVAPEETYSMNDARSAPVRSSVKRSSLPPVAGTTASSAPFERAEQAAVEEVEEPIRTASVAKPNLPAPIAKKQVVEPEIDPLSRSVERSAGVSPEVARKDPAGWSSAGATRVTAKEGETVYNLSRRYGVPAKVLSQVNGLDGSGNLQAGQKVIIPTYIYSDRAPVSAPDNDPRVANAKSSRGNNDPNAPLKAAELPEPKDISPSKGNQTAKNGVYVVGAGDSLLGIARDNGTTMAAIRNANGMENDNLRIGQKLKIPGAGSATTTASAKSADKPVEKKPTTVAKSETAPAKPVKSAAATQPKNIDPAQTASTQPVKKKEIAAAATKEAAEKAKLVAYTPPATKAVAEVEKSDESAAPSGTGIGKMRWPVKGRVVSGFGKGGGNAKDGIDIQVPEGTAVKAAENGVVIYAGNGLKDFGNTVLVRHDNGLVTVYGNASALNVKRGQTVKRGEQIATSGMSGAATAPKLHFEVRKNSSPVDPSTFLE